MESATVVPQAADTERAVHAGPRLRVLVVDDHSIVHFGFRLLLGAQPWVERCVAARRADEAVELALRYEPHVALVDLFVGEESGADICGQLRRRSPATRVLLISGAGQMSRKAALAAGASGFVAKDRPAAELAAAVQQVGLGHDVFPADRRGPALFLTHREREVLGHMAAGATNREIARSLSLSPHTVKDHSSALFRKLAARNRTQAVQRAQLLGLL